MSTKIQAGAEKQTKQNRA